MREEGFKIFALRVELSQMPGPQPRVAVAADRRHDLDEQLALVVAHEAVDRGAIGHAGDAADGRVMADEPAEADPRAGPHSDAEGAALGLLAVVVLAVPGE